MADTWTITRGEGYGGKEYAPGTILAVDDPTLPRGAKGRHVYAVVLTSKTRYYREDGMSFGVGDEKGHVYTHTLRPVTAAELARRIDDEHGDAIELDAIRELTQLRKIEGWEYAPKAARWPDGETLIKDISDARLYGGGWEFRLVGDEVYYIQGNGADGDDWSYNNLPSAIAHRTPAVPELVAQLRSILHRLPKVEAALAAETARDNARRAKEAKSSALAKRAGEVVYSDGERTATITKWGMVELRNLTTDKTATVPPGLTPAEIPDRHPLADALRKAKKDRTQYRKYDATAMPTALAEALAAL